MIYLQCTKYIDERKQTRMNREKRRKDNMKKMMDAACELEHIHSQLKYVTGVSKVCAVAYDSEDSFGNISEEETANAFYSIHAQLKEVTDEVNALISMMFHDGAENMHENESQAD